MKTHIYLLIFFTLPYFVGAQKNIKKFYSLLNKAELSIVNGKYKSALRNYSKASMIHELFARDFNNAFWASFYAKDNKRGLFYFKKLASLTYKLDLSAPVFDTLKSHLWYEDIEYILNSQKPSYDTLKRSIIKK
jgi:hypothetical protein